MRIFHDLSVCEDCVQEAFISLWDNREEMASTAHVKSFLYQVSRNNALNHLKHERVKSEYMAKGVQELESQVCFINYVIEEEAERILAETEQELAPKCREIFKLAMQGKDNEEIARLLGVSENTVKTQKKIAYKKLKQKIAEVTMLLLLLNQVVGE
ncbi:sigma-70 family RNA polymerase sigma factor [Butyricimonas faecihominis]|uniref:sigma-70 family RNA polymerase sigma factor n=1 Tax=Butyricimonas faecihominis TaxID=1472416 RepID=UPI0026706F52|nr:sigma-70 family RNA polymerase sigma factor [Butyricimonas faecihominis]